MALNGLTLPPGWISVEGDGPMAHDPPSSAPPDIPPLPHRELQLPTLRTRTNPVMRLLCPPPLEVASPMKLQSIAAARALFLPSASSSLPPHPRFPRRQPRVNYQPQLNFRAPTAPWVPTVTPPKPPRAQLHDPSAVHGSLYTASSRLGHGIISVFAKCPLSFSIHDPPPTIV